MRKCGCFSLSNLYTTNWRLAFDCPFWKTAWNSSFFFIRFFSSYHLTLLYFISGNSLLLEKKTTERSVVYADNTFLPLRRRAASTLRPFAVFHTAAETMYFAALTFIWLVSSFHYMTPP